MPGFPGLEVLPQGSYNSRFPLVFPGFPGLGVPRFLNFPGFPVIFSKFSRLFARVPGLSRSSGPRGAPKVSRFFPGFPSLRQGFQFFFNFSAVFQAGLGVLPGFLEFPGFQGYRIPGRPGFSYVSRPRGSGMSRLSRFLDVTGFPGARVTFPRSSEGPPPRFPVPGAFPGCSGFPNAAHHQIWTAFSRIPGVDEVKEIKKLEVI